MQIALSGFCGLVGASGYAAFMTRGSATEDYCKHFGVRSLSALPNHEVVAKNAKVVFDIVSQYLPASVDSMREQIRSLDALILRVDVAKSGTVNIKKSSSLMQEIYQISRRIKDALETFSEQLQTDGRHADAYVALEDARQDLMSSVLTLTDTANSILINANP